MTHQWTSSSSFLDPWTEDEDVHLRVSSLEPAIEYSFSARVFLDELDRVLDLVEGFLGELKLVLELVEGFLEELKLVLVLVELFGLLVQQP
jgi:hypothetical protein